MTGAVQGSQARRHWTDYAGAIFTVAFLVLLVARTGQPGLLLLPSLIKEAATAAAFLMREPAVRKATDIRARAVAYGATFVFPIVLLVAHEARPELLALTGSVTTVGLGCIIWLCGMFAALWAVVALRRSFSIEPQARRLVTSGPYAIARHPIYASYLAVNGGFVLMHLNPLWLAAFGVWLILVIDRTSAEEEVLAAAFPAEYADYRRRVGRFLPRLGRVDPMASPETGDSRL